MRISRAVALRKPITAVLWTASQHAQYTENQRKQFNKRARSNDNAVVHGIASKLSALELKAVAAHLSGLQ